MTTTTDETAPVTFGCTVDDVLRLLPHVDIGAPVVDPVYGPTQVRKLTRTDVEGFIVSVASRVQARIYRYEQVPDRVREHIRTMARDLVANGAAHYVQAAVHPGASNPNDGSSYAARLWDRFTTDLDEVRATIQAELDNPSTGPNVTGGVSGYSPAPLFPDEMRF